MPTLARRPPIEEIWMKWPSRCARSAGNAARVTFTTPKKFVSICARRSSLPLRQHPCLRRSARGRTFEPLLDRERVAEDGQHGAVFRPVGRLFRADDICQGCDRELLISDRDDL